MEKRQYKVRWFAAAIAIALITRVSMSNAGENRNTNYPDGPTSPNEVIALFNGRDLSGLYTWQSDTRHADPRNIYSVKEGILRISGEGLGYVATKLKYRDYRLVVEYKWGEWTNNRGTVRNSGILLHASGEDGNYKRLWMTSIECQLAQGCEGDLIVIRGADSAGSPIPASVTADTVLGSDGKTRWSPAGKKTVCSGHQLWWSKHDPEFKELLDTRGRWDVASPVGEWTRVECICDGNRISIRVNGELVNEAFDVEPAAGKILLQNEGHEIFFRTFELHPLSTSTSHD